MWARVCKCHTFKSISLAYRYGDAAVVVDGASADKDVANAGASFAKAARGTDTNE